MAGRSSVVETSAGSVRGVAIDGVAEYLGIPYGDSVSGQYRFSCPRPHPGWRGVLEATSFGPGAPQGDPRVDAADEYGRLLRLLYPGTGTPLEGRASAEDALVLNVWSSTAETGSKPVMVWLHGGGFVHGTGAEGWFQGDRLARRGDVTVVSINHRLGVLGFLPVVEALGVEARASSVAGMLDIVLALEWIRDNIAAFGGDPANVTVFGQSGGGAKVATLTAMPAARGLFHKAIVQSGPRLRAVDPSEASKNLERLLHWLGVSDPADLRTVEAARLVEAQQAALEAGRSATARAGTLPNWGPVLHPAELPRHPFVPSVDASVDAVPLLVGTTTHESALQLSTNSWYHSMTDQDLEARFLSLFGEEGSELVGRYREIEAGAVPQLILARAVTDRRWRVPAAAMRGAKAAQSAPVFSYRFDYRTEVLNGVMGAHHSLDLPFVFDNVDRSPATGADPRRLAVAAEMSAAWARFARTGDPAGGELADWRAFGDRGETLVIGTEVRTEKAEAPAVA